MKYIVSYVEAGEKALDMTWWKVILASLAAVAGYFFPEPATQHLALTAFVFVFLDTITGMRAALISGQKLESSKFGRVLSKLVGYGAIVIVARLVPEATQMPQAWQGMSVAAFLALVVTVEGLSIVENVLKMKILPAKIAVWLAERIGK